MPVQQAHYPLLYLGWHYFITQATNITKIKQSNMVRGPHTADLSCGPGHSSLLPLRNSTIKYSKHRTVMDLSNSITRENKQNYIYQHKL